MDTNEKKKNFDLIKIARFVASRQSGFMYAILGVVVQGWHTYHIGYDISSLNGWQQILQAILMSLFISGGLMYNTLKSKITIEVDKDGKEIKKYNKAFKSVLWFAILETIINLAYWTNKLLYIPYNNGEVIDWLAWAISLVFSLALPLALKNYASEIRVDDPIDELADELSKDDFIKLVDVEDKLLPEIKKIFESQLKAREDEMSNVINEIEAKKKLFTELLESNSKLVHQSNKSSLDIAKTRRQIILLLNILKSKKHSIINASKIYTNTRVNEVLEISNDNSEEISILNKTLFSVEQDLDIYGEGLGNKVELGGEEMSSILINHARIEECLTQFMKDVVAQFNIINSGLEDITKINNSDDTDKINNIEFEINSITKKMDDFTKLLNVEDFKFMFRSKDGIDKTYDVKLVRDKTKKKRNGDIIKTSDNRTLRQQSFFKKKS